METNILLIKHINKTLNKGKISFLLKDISLKVESNQIISLVGESGSGKTTIAKIIQGLIKEDSGKIIFNSQDITKYSLKQRSKIIQTIFQNPANAFNPKYKILTNLIEIIKHAFPKYPKTYYIKTILEYTKTLGLNPNKLKHYPHQLSGGEIQRFAIIRAILVRPAFLIADEITSSLDTKNTNQIINLLSNIRKKFNIGIIFISHDINIVKDISNFVYIFYKGKIIEKGETQTLLANPKKQYTKLLIDSTPNPQNREIYLTIK